MGNYCVKRTKRKGDPPFSPGQPWTRQDGLGKGEESNWEVKFFQIYAVEGHALYIPDYE